MILKGRGGFSNGGGGGGGGGGEAGSLNNFQVAAEAGNLIFMVKGHCYKLQSKSYSKLIAFMSGAVAKTQSGVC